MLQRLLYYIIVVLTFLFIWTISVHANTELPFMLEWNQPQLNVIELNQAMEQVKTWLLSSVSIFTDDDLYRQWSGVLISVLILIVILIIYQVFKALVQWSKDNLIKFFAIIILLFFVAASYAPIFSALSGALAGEEITYKDPTSWKDISRVYLPANTAIVVKNSYVDKNGNRKYMYQDESLLPKRWDRSVYSWETLWVPAKVAQTQWQSNNDPTFRFSTAFYWVNLDYLFENTDYNSFLPPGNLAWVDSCKLELDPLFFIHRKSTKSPTSLLEALGKLSWADQAKELLEANDGTPTKKFIYEGLPGSPEDPSTKQPLEVDFTKNGACKIPTWLYFLSNNFLKTLWSKSQFGSQKPEIKVDDNFRHNLYSNPFWSLGLLTTHPSFSALEWLNYQEQKKFIYSYKAASILYKLTQQELNNSVREWSLKLKDTVHACSRIVLWEVTSIEDYKTCLRVDQMWDTTMYTAEASQKIGILWKNQSITRGYVMPVPSTLDWDLRSVSVTYGDIKNMIDKIQEATTDWNWNFSVTQSMKSVAWNASWLGLLTGMASDYWSAAWWWIQSIFTDSEEWKASKLVEELWLSDLNLSKQDKVAVGKWLLQTKALLSEDTWYMGTFEPYLASFQSYDINGDGEVDYKWTDQLNELRTNGHSYYWYHFWSSNPTLTKDTVNYTQMPVYKEIDLGQEIDVGVTWQGSIVFWNISDKRVNWYIQIDWKNEKYTVWSFNYSSGQGNSIPMTGNTYFIPSSISWSVKPYCWIPWRATSYRDWWTTKAIVCTEFKILNAETWSPQILESEVSKSFSQFLTPLDGLIWDGNKELSVSDPVLQVWFWLEDKVFWTPDIRGEWYKIYKRNWDQLVAYPGLDQNQTYTQLEGKDISEYKSKMESLTFTTTSLAADSNTLEKQTKWNQIGVKNWWRLISLDWVLYREIEWQVQDLEGVYLRDWETLSQDKVYYYLKLHGNWTKYQHSGNQLLVDWRFKRKYDKVLWFILDDKRLWAHDNNVSTTVQKIVEDWKKNEVDNVSKWNSEVAKKCTWWKWCLWNSFVKQVHSAPTLTHNSWAFNVNVTKDNQIVQTEKLTIKKLDYKELGDYFSTDQLTRSVSPRLLVNPNYNIPLTYSPINSGYYSKYKDTGNVCMINTSWTTSYSHFFDAYPGKDISSCSMIWDHVRLSDIRLLTFKQEGWFLSTWEYKDIFSHVSIPLLTNNSVSWVSKDRREQNYAWEMSSKWNVIEDVTGTTRVAWIRVQEGDIAILKPWVTLGALQHPYTLLVPTEITPYLEYVTILDPNTKTQPSKAYKWGLYDFIVSSISFVKWGSANKTWTNVQESTEKRYLTYSFDKFDSRPDILKTLEGNVPERYFTAYYWEAYYNDNNVPLWIVRWFNEMVYELLWTILKYRVDIIKFLLIWSPLYTFLLIVPSLRKWFTLPTAIIIWLLVLPIIVLLLINSFVV